MAAGAAGAATAGHTRGLPVNGPSGGAAIVTDTHCTSTSPTVPSNDCAMAGYQASNRLFRYAQASIVVPAHTGVVGTDAALYVALSNNSNTAYDNAQVGITPCPATGGTGICPATDASGWAAFAQVREVDASTVNHTYALPATDEGLGVFVSVYLSPTGNSIHTVITTPTTTTTSGGVTTTTTGSTYYDTIPVSGPVYTDAQALADWNPGTASTQTVPVPPTTANTSAYDQFFDGRFTTWSGTKGTFNGKWTVNPVEATLLGAAPTALSVITGPSYLWTNDKYPGDAFGVWIYNTTAAP